MLLSMRYVLSLTAARFLCGAGGALSGGGGGSSLALEKAVIAKLLPCGKAPKKRTSGGQVSQNVTEATSRCESEVCHEFFAGACA